MPILKSSLQEVASTPARTFEIVKSILLLVEGQDDQELFAAIGAQMGVDDLQIIDMGGKTNWNKKIAGIVSGPPFEKVKALRLARDADGDFSAALASLSDALARNGLPTASSQLTVATDGRRTTMIMILPGPVGTRGELEDLLLEEISQTQYSDCIDALLNCTSAAGIGPSSKLSKSKVQTYLALQDEPAKTLKVGIERGNFNLALDIYDNCRLLLGGLDAALQPPV
jgi:hypothetical protein